MITGTFWSDRSCHLFFIQLVLYIFDLWTTVLKIGLWKLHNTFLDQEIKLLLGLYASGRLYSVQFW
jgi:hypothetical protein